MDKMKQQFKTMDFLSESTIRCPVKYFLYLRANYCKQIYISVYNTEETENFLERAPAPIGDCAKTVYTNNRFPSPQSSIRNLRRIVPSNSSVSSSCVLQQFTFLVNSQITHFFLELYT